MDEFKPVAQPEPAVLPKTPEAPKEPDFKNHATDEQLCKDTLKFVTDLHKRLVKKRKPFEKIWAECQDAYRCVENKTFFQGPMPYCSSDLRDSVLQIVPKHAKAVFYTDTPFDLIPIGPDKGNDKEIAEINKKVIAWDFRNLRVYLKYVDAIFQKYIFGTCIVKTPAHFEMVDSWKDEKEPQQQMVGVSYGQQALKRSMVSQREFMGTDFVVVDLFNFWVDPETVARGQKDAVEFGDCVETMIVKWTDLEDGKKRGIYENVDKCKEYYIGSNKRGSTSDTANQKRVKMSANINQTDEGGVNSGNPFTRNKSNQSYELKETYAEYDLGSGIVPVLITSVADKQVIRIQEWKGSKPYLSNRYIPNGYNKEFYGTGMIEPQLSNHYERNATRKQVISARTMGLNMEMLSDQTGFPNKPDKLRTSPNKIHYVRNINGVKPWEKPIGQILQSAITHEQNLKEETRQATGNTLSITGQPTPQNDTATGIGLLQQSGNERFSLPIQVDETGLLEPYVKRCLINNIMFRKEDFVIRLTDKTPVRVYPSDLSANFDVYCLGSSELQNKQIRQQGLQQAWAMSMEAAPMEAQMYGQPLTKFPELKKEIYANNGISQPEKFCIDPKDLQQQQQLLTPEMEWILIQRMSDGSAKPMPIMIQPGEDLKAHYEDHLAKMNEEDFQNLSPMAQAIWQAHVFSYRKPLNYLETKKREERSAMEAEKSEVAVSY